MIEGYEGYEIGPLSADAVNGLNDEEILDIATVVCRHMVAENPGYSDDNFLELAREAARLTGLKEQDVIFAILVERCL